MGRDETDARLSGGRMLMGQFNWTAEVSSTRLWKGDVSLPYMPPALLLFCLR